MSERSGSDDLDARLESASHQRVVEDSEHNARILGVAALLLAEEVPSSAFVQALRSLDPNLAGSIATGEELRDRVVSSVAQRAASEQAIADAARKHI